MQTLDCLLCGSQAPADEAPRATAARTAFWPRVLEGGWERRRTSSWTVSSLWRRERESPGALPNSSAGWWWGLKKSSWVGYLMWEKAHLSTRTAIQTHTLAPGHVCGGPSKWIWCCMEGKPNYHTSQSHYWTCKRSLQLFNMPIFLIMHMHKGVINYGHELFMILKASEQKNLP